MILYNFIGEQSVCHELWESWVVSWAVSCESQKPEDKRRWCELWHTGTSMDRELWRRLPVNDIPVMITKRQEKPEQCWGRRNIACRSKWRRSCEELRAVSCVMSCELWAVSCELLAVVSCELCECMYVWTCLSVIVVCCRIGVVHARQ